MNFVSFGKEGCVIGIVLLFIFSFYFFIREIIVINIFLYIIWISVMYIMVFNKIVNIIFNKGFIFILFII